MDGRFSAGFPRRDGGEELNARIRVINRPVSDLRHAFGIDDYDVDGNLSGEFHLYGPYRRPQGFGNVSLTNGVAYGEAFDTALAAVRFEGEGVRLDNMQLTKSGGRGTGAAFIGWTSGSYSFNLDARDIPIESLTLARNTWVPLSGLLDFSAGGSGTFDDPRYVLKGTVRDLFAGDEGIGQVGGEIGVIENVVTLKLEAASSRLAVSGAGRIELTPGRDADITFRVTDTSLDPYVRALQPRLSPFTTAVASGSIRVSGRLRDMDRLSVETVVEALDMRLFDYRLRNAAPLRFALERQHHPAGGRAAGGRGHGARALGVRQPARRADGHADEGRREPRHPAGLRREHPRLGPRRAGGDARGQHARAAAHRAR